MSKKDFEEEIKRIQLSIDSWSNKLRILQEKSLTEMIDDNYKHALETSIKNEMYRLNCFLYVKRILDKPVRKKKLSRFDSTCKYPKEFPTRVQSGTKSVDKID